MDLDSFAVKESGRTTNAYLPPPTAHSQHPHLIPSLPLKRKREARENHGAPPPPKVGLTWPPPKWEPPRRVPKGEVNKPDGVCAASGRSLADVGEDTERSDPEQILQLQPPATRRPLQQAKEEADVRRPRIQVKANFLPATLMFDPRVKEFGKLNPQEKTEILEMAGKARALVLTLVYRDGTTQLDPEQVRRAPWAP